MSDKKNVNTPNSTTQNNQIVHCPRCNAALRVKYATVYMCPKCSASFEVKKIKDRAEAQRRNEKTVKTAKERTKKPL